MTKYEPLFAYLSTKREGQILIGFHKLEELLAEPLPVSAYEYREWWANEDPRATRHVHSKAWTEAGWEVEKVDLKGEAVMFRRRNAK